METTTQSRGLWWLAIGLGVLALLGQEQVRSADVRVNVNIGPPPIVVPAPPAVVLIPGSAVYFVPHPEIDVFFHGGYWWSPRGPHWYRAGAYNGPWAVVEHRLVPHPVIGVPKGYRSAYKKEPHIPYGQWKKQHEQQTGDHRKDDRDDKKDHKPGGGHGRK